MSDPITVELNDWIWPAGDTPIWSYAKNAKNYLSVISEDAPSPGGLKRDFKAHTKTPVTGFVMKHVAPGDPVEIGCTDTDESGTVKRTKAWIVPISITKWQMHYYKFPRWDEAIVFSVGHVATQPQEGGPVATIQRRIVQTTAHISRLTDELAEMQQQLRELSGAAVPLCTPIADVPVEQESPGLRFEMPADIEVTPSLPLPVTRLAAVAPDDDDDELPLTPAQLKALGA